jgi:hypothetical protein
VAIGVQVGLALALGTAFVSMIGFLLKHRGAVQAAEVEWRRPLRSSVALFSSGAYSAGILVAMVAWGLHVGALALAPISLVQSVIAGGLVFLTVAADRFFGHDVTRREWIGVALTALGLAFLAATMSGTGSEAHSSYGAGTLGVYVALISLLGMVFAVAGWNAAGGATVVGVGAGLLWGGSDVSIKALSDSLGDDGILVLLHPLALVILLLSLVGLLVSARSLQRGAAVPVIAATTAAANISTIAAGPIVFGEPMPQDAAGVALRLLAFALVVVAAWLTPPGTADASARPAT